MQRLFLFALMTVLLSACIASGRKTGSMSVSATIPAAAPEIFPAAASTITPTLTLALPPSPTPVPPTLILADFPLSVGANWKYSAELSYQDPKDYAKQITWSGFIMDKVVD